MILTFLLVLQFWQETASLTNVPNVGITRHNHHSWLVLTIWCLFLNADRQTTGQKRQHTTTTNHTNRYLVSECKKSIFLACSWMVKVRKPSNNSSLTALKELFLFFLRFFLYVFSLLLAFFGFYISTYILYNLPSRIYRWRFAL